MLTFLMERLVPLCNTVMAAWAFRENLLAVKLGPPAHRRVRASIAALCALYVVAYSLLWTGIVTGAIDRNYWSRHGLRRRHVLAVGLGLGSEGRGQVLPRRPHCGRTERGAV